MKKIYILFTIFILVIICIIYIFSMFNKQSNDLSDQNIEEKNQNSILNDVSEQKIENIKDDLGYNNVNSEMYEIKSEYDGREVIVIKPDIQYKVAIAGAIKNEKPEFSELDKLIEQVPNKSGIWITKKSREKLLNILKQLTNSNYVIDEDGYLVQEQYDNSNEIDVKIKQIIDKKKLFVIDINSITYIVDEVTGNIEEYPFVEIDPKTHYEIFKTENATLYVINPNINKKLNEIDMIKEIITSIDV